MNESSQEAIHKETSSNHSEKLVSPISIMLTSAPKVGFASQQNSVALIKELSIENKSDHALEDLRLTITSTPLVIEEKSWVIERIDAGTVINISDRDIKLNAEKLFALNEHISAELVIQVTSKSEEDKGQQITIASASKKLEVLPKSHWGGDWLYGRIVTSILYA